MSPVEDIRPPDPDKLFRELCELVRGYNDNDEAVALIESAYRFAKEKHSDQKRRSGEPYITHPLEVAKILTNFKVDQASIASAILHDVVEDTETTVEDIEQEFGKTIAQLVDGLTKIGKIKFTSSQERMAENFRKMVLAMAKDLRVIIVKLADRLHNMRTLGSLPAAKRQRIAQETLDIYAPIANRLGIYGMKGELEDLCLKETKHSIYKEIAAKIAAKKNERERYISEVNSILEKELEKYGFSDAKVYGRPKHFFSIYRKMVDRQLAFEDIHDLFAFRIIVNTIKDCYEALGIIHAMWKPMPGRFKDYIAMPKANMYQSLHTTVIREDGYPAEIQIRTYEMHQTCELGVAAHWAYKDQAPMAATGKDMKRFSWLRQIMELQNELKDPDEFLAAVKVDLFDEEIFVFTPKGDVIQLSVGSTPLDFAFAVHSDIGLRTVGAKINGRIIPLRSKLANGDIVEVFTNPNQTPSKDWLGFVTTSKAKSKIRSFLRAQQRDQSKKLGREILDSELDRKHKSLETLNSTHSTQLIKAAKESSIDDILIAIGYGKLNAADLVDKVFPDADEQGKPMLIPGDHSPPTRTPRNRPSGGVLVSGLQDILVSFGKCCNPLPGEEIVGFITRGRGVSVHQKECSRAHDLDPQRRIVVSWEDDKNRTTTHTCSLKIVTNDRKGILADVTSAIASCGANILKAQVRVSVNMKGILDFEIGVKDLEQLRTVVRKIESVSDVLMVERKSMEYSSRMFGKND